MRGLLLFLALGLAACSGEIPTPPPAEAVVIGYEAKEALQEILNRFRVLQWQDEPALRAARLVMPQAEAERLQGEWKTLALRFLEKEAQRWLLPVAEGPISQTLSPAWHLEALRAREAWSTATGRGVVVAVGDTGIDGTHPLLAGRILEGYDPKGERPLPPDQDWSGGLAHGTHVAGLVVAQEVGVAPGAKVMPLLLFDPDYVGDFYAARAIRFAVDHGARVINLSFGGPGYSQVLHEAINYALERLVVVVASAGNQGSGLWTYPAAFPGVISVGAYDGRGEIAWFSNRGNWVSLYAPGVRILSTVPGQGLGPMSGTSMAAPLVSGGVALLKERSIFIGSFAAKTALAQGFGPDLVQALAAPHTPGGCLNLEIRDAQGMPLEGVEVNLYGGGQSFWGRTNALGQVQFREIGPGVYALAAYHLGQSRVWGEVEVSGACVVPRVFSF